ncbi:MAG: hypothetical protein ACR2KG_00305 [Nocardioidaceae bacterium]
MSSREPVGSLAEEAARLAAVLRGWAGEDGRDRSDAEAVHSEAIDDVPGHEPASECHHCPICTVVRAAKGTSPQTRQHLANAAMSLVMAMEEMLKTSPGTAARNARDSGEEIELPED